MFRRRKAKSLDVLLIETGLALMDPALRRLDAAPAGQGDVRDLAQVKECVEGLCRVMQAAEERSTPEWKATIAHLSEAVDTASRAVRKNAG